MAVDDVVEWVPQDGSVTPAHVGQWCFWVAHHPRVVGMKRLGSGDEYIAGRVILVDDRRVRLLWRMP